MLKMCCSPLFAFCSFCSLLFNVGVADVVAVVAACMCVVCAFAFVNMLLLCARFNSLLFAAVRY